MSTTAVVVFHFLGSGQPLPVADYSRVPLKMCRHVSVLWLQICFASELKTWHRFSRNTRKYTQDRAPLILRLMTNEHLLTLCDDGGRGSYRHTDVAVKSQHLWTYQSCKSQKLCISWCKELRYHRNACMSPLFHVDLPVCGHLLFSHHWRWKHASTCFFFLVVVAFCSALSMLTAAGTRVTVGSRQPSPGFTRLPWRPVWEVSSKQTLAWADAAG